MPLAPRMILILVCGCLPTIGCQENSAPRQPAKLQHDRELNQAEITGIAIQTVVEQTKIPSQQLEAEASMEGDDWSVFVTRSGPEASPGDHWLFTIDRYGVVREFYLGM